ncbi:hypothetical protein FXV77_21855 [Sphingobacterium phlebotomi]|uniref:Uncharacterized protein n=1 Tax=Sphingobacterium phlebotomi TaxID=2605433 RepID=A0A5D4GR27_9SPHI|nr:hypothetical protein [Sphingobacterium phlebotomi]TYR30778.1 hypothetical protein FXV77_21855 [Sphingobacterium phlebotomi]
MNSDKLSTYISIFKRKGGEGLYTKIIKESNERDYSSLFSQLEEKEKPLLIYFINLLNWFMLTNNRILMSEEGKSIFLYLTDITEVRPALQEEMNEGIVDKRKFTKLKIKIKNGKSFVSKLEEGQPYQGIYQVLHFIANNNNSR